MTTAPHAWTAPEMVETHSGLVFLLGDRALKLKKPVDLGFLDFRERTVRERACHREVELNARMAPDVYLGVSDVLGPDGTPCDHLVTMRRLPDVRRLSTLAVAGADAREPLRLLAHQLATLHGASPHDATIDAAATTERTRARWQSNTASLIRATPGLFDDEVVGVVHGLACRYLDGRGPLFDQRIRDRRSVDGHGDLLADDVFCLEDGPRALDCIEFDDQLRYGDGLSDAAFLAMDLEHLGRPDLARWFLDRYAEATGDVWPASLEHHHVAYRAQVRAKVAAIRADQGDPHAMHRARLHLAQARAHLEAGRVRMVLVGGLPGTGKSTLAAGLEDRLGATVLRSDEVRKALGRGPTWTQDEDDFCRGLYAAETTAATYGLLLDRARTALALGETVVLDASWADPAHRAAARGVADATSADLVELRLDLPEEVAVERLRARAAIGRDPSDATPAIAALLAARATPWRTAHQIDGLEATTALAQALALLGASPSPTAEEVTA